MAGYRLASLPVASFASKKKTIAGGTLIFGVAIVWAISHAVGIQNALRGYGSPLAITFAISFLLLWWVPLSWFERPTTVTDEEEASLQGLVVTVHVPVYNEDPTTLREALSSVFDQTRLPTRIHVVDDGSQDEHGYDDVRAWFEATAAELGIVTVWRRTINRGKRHAQMETLRHDDADIWITLDSDSTLDRNCIREGMKRFVDPEVMSVAGMVVVWNSRRNWLTRLTCMLYTPFTRGFRPAQSMLGRVMVNSGTLAFYRADAIRPYIGSYENEQFRGRPMQMNDDSMLTFYGLLAGKCVHQPTAVSFTIVPEKVKHYLNQQLRWMRGTFVRTGWWVKYLPITDVAWWMPVLELMQLFIGLVMVPVILIMAPAGTDFVGLFLSGLVVGIALNYLVALRYFMIERSDESGWVQLGTFALAPIAGLWRLVVLRPMIVYAMLTFWKVGRWGTREQVEVALEPAAA